MRILRVMNADKAKTQTKRPVNLTLSASAVRRAKALKRQLNRPSISNLVEHLILEAAKAADQKAVAA